MEAVVTASAIGKSFGSTRALRDINFSLNPSEIFGFIGPDGAGKTTLFRLITTLLIPDEGRLTVLGHDSVTDYRAIRQHIGYMPGRFSLYMDLTVEENLGFYATVFGTTIDENYELIRDIYAHIEPFKNRPAGKLSGGMKQKLALSCALIHKPALLVLDEPTTGVDAVSRAEFWEMLQKLREHHITILVSTPYMDEAMRCDRVALIQDGRLLAIDTPGRIRDHFPGKLYSVISAKKYPLLLALRQFEGTLSAFPFGESIHVRLKEPHGELDLVRYLAGKGFSQALVCETQAGIEDRFLELMEKETNPADRHA